MKKTKAIILILAVCGSLLSGCKNPVEEGTKLLKDKKYEKAVSAFEDAAEKWEDNDNKKILVAESYRGKGIAYWELGQYEKAKKAFVKAIKMGTKETGTIYNFLGICEMKLGQPDEAVNYFQKGIECKNNSEELEKEMMFNQISAYEELKDWETAKAKALEYTAKYPDDEKMSKEAEFLETR